MWILPILRAFENENIDYAVVGGFALALHGVVRGTVDLDLAVAVRRDTFLKTEETLKALGLIPRLPLKAEDVFQFRQEYIDHRNLKAWSFYDPLSGLRQVDIIITEDPSTFEVKRITVQNQTIRIPSLEALIAMKKRSGRPQDLEDIKALEKLTKPI